MSAMAFGKIGTRPLFKHWTARDYVQNGLVAMWDGIETGGFGITQFGQSNFSWVNLATGEPLATNQYTVAYEDGVGVSITYGFSARPFGLSSEDSEWTVEYVVKFPSLSGTNRSFIRGDVGSSIVYYPALNGPNASGEVTSIGVGYAYQLTLSILAGNITYAAYVRSDTAHTMILKGNELEGTRNASPNITSFPASSFWIADYMLGATDNMRLKCIRVYSYALTAAEIAANYAVDKLRFNLP